MQISLSQEEANPLALVSRIIILKFTWESLVFDKFCKDSKTHQWARFRVCAGLKGLFTNFFPLFKSHILDSNGVWYS